MRIDIFVISTLRTKKYLIATSIRFSLEGQIKGTL